MAYKKGDRLGRFIILQTLPSSGTAQVYKAQIVEREEKVILKVARGAEADRLKNEAEILPFLCHPHIIKILPALEMEGKNYYAARNPETDEWYIALEYISGGSLEEKLGQKGRLDLQEALAIIIQVGSALAYAHSKGIIHRDVKPGNVLFRRANAEIEAVLSDFGIAAEGRRAKADKVIGTLPYVSPEQVKRALGENTTVDERTDIYSLGVLLYEMLTGVKPFMAKGKEELLKVIKDKEPIPPSELNPAIPRTIEEVILKALEKEPFRRFQTVEEMLKTLRRA